MRTIFYIIALIILTACSLNRKSILSDTKAILADKNATDQTAILFLNIRNMTGQKILYGQHNYETDGRTSDSTYWRDEKNHCDAYDITGAYPSVASFDFLHLTNPVTWETKNWDLVKKMVYKAYNRGNVITFCWHYYNPITGNNFYDTTNVVSKILPGGSHYQKFKESLISIADFANHLKGKNNELIPVIFRPWHELDGNWFWWGKNHCTADEFKNLYQFTVTFLRDSLNVHNFLYAFSPDCKFSTMEEYLERYPGDSFVDVIGMDNYWDLRANSINEKQVILKSRIISKYASKHNKLCAITETGTQGRDSLWFSKLLKILRTEGININYVCTWSGFAPYKGHPAEKDFCKFKNDPLIVFSDEINNIYSLN